MEKWPRTLSGKSQKKTTNRHMKRCLTLLNIRVMHIEATMRYHYTYTRIADNIKSWQACGETRPYILLWECELLQPLWEEYWQYLLKLKIYMPCDSAVLLLDIYPIEICVHQAINLHFLMWGKKIPIWDGRWKEDEEQVRGMKLRSI